MGNLIANYEGNLSLLHDQASSSSDLEKRLKELGKGIGDVTVSIFLRELRLMPNLLHWLFWQRKN